MSQFVLIAIVSVFSTASFSYAQETTGRITIPNDPDGQTRPSDAQKKNDKKKKSESKDQTVRIVVGENQKADSTIKTVVAGIEEEKAPPIIIPRAGGHPAFDQLVPLPKFSLLTDEKKASKKPFLAIPDDQLEAFLGKYRGYAGKPANHINFNGTETVILSSRELNLSPSAYPKVPAHPEGLVMVGGMETKFVKPEDLSGYISRFPGIKGLPSNYVRIGNLTVVVLPFNSGPGFIYSLPADHRISPNEQSTRWVNPGTGSSGTSDPAQLSPKGH